MSRNLMPALVIAEPEDEVMEINLDEEGIFGEIAHGDLVEGVYSTTRGLYVKGGVRGGIKCEGTVLIAESAQVIGEVEANKVILLGKVKGDIYADEVIMGQTGVIDGHLLYRSITVYRGALVTGDFLPLERGQLLVSVQVPEGGPAHTKFLSSTS